MSQVCDCGHMYNSLYITCPAVLLRDMYRSSWTANRVYFLQINHCLLQIYTDLIILINHSFSVNVILRYCTKFAYLHTTFRRRDVNRKKAAQLLREGKRSEARDCLTKCIDITPHMALQLMNVCTAGVSSLLLF